MTDKKKPNLRIVKDRPEILTPKQRHFVDLIVKGKVTYKEAYAEAYDVTLTKSGKIPKWVEVESSKLLALPKIALSVQRLISKREDGSVASGIRTKNYVLERLMKESKEADSDASRVRALELLGKTIGIFTDVVEQREERASEVIAEEIEEKIIRLLEESQND